ncbi:MAG: YadA C-terminal domain-containing protein [Pseudomonadales bacterium]
MASGSGDSSTIVSTTTSSLVQDPWDWNESYQAYIGTQVSTNTATDSFSGDLTEFVVINDGEDKGVYTTVGEGTEGTVIETVETLKRELVVDNEGDIVAITTVVDQTTVTNNTDVAYSYEDIETDGTRQGTVSDVDTTVTVDGEVVSGSQDYAEGYVMTTAGSVVLGAVDNEDGSWVVVTGDGIDLNSDSVTVNGVAVADEDYVDDANDLQDLAIAVNAIDIGDNAWNIGVNAGEISANASAISSNTGRIEDLEDEVDMNEETASRGIAIANAMETFLPDPGKKFRLNVGGGFYNSESAIGITGAGRVGKKGDTALYIGVGSDIDGEEIGGKVGVSFQW